MLQEKRLTRALYRDHWSFTNPFLKKRPIDGRSSHRGKLGLCTRECLNVVPSERKQDRRNIFLRPSLIKTDEFLYTPHSTSIYVATETPKTSRHCMLFNTVEFIAFFVVVLGLYSALNHRWQNRLLLVGSYFFYGCWDYRFLSLIVISTVIDYVSGIKIHGSDNRRTRKFFLVLRL